MIPKTYYVWNPFISSTTLFENQPFFCILRGRLYVICTTIRKMTLNVNSNKFRVEIEREYCILFLQDQNLLYISISCHRQLVESGFEILR